MDKIINKVIEQIKLDITIGDTESIFEMLKYVPEENLMSYLPEVLDFSEIKKEFLVKMVSDFELYPSVTDRDDKDYIVAYLNDESCTFSNKDIQQYIVQNA